MALSPSALYVLLFAIMSNYSHSRSRTDVFGQIFPHFGKDWSQKGVAELFSNIRANGYQIVYLTARAIGAVRITCFDTNERMNRTVPYYSFNI